MNYLKAYRHNLSICLLLLITSVGQLRAGDVDDWVQKAIGLGLDKSRAWQVLVHYRPYAHGWQSLISDTNFFLAPTGNHDPRAELEATIRAWLEPASSKRSMGSLCRFPARIYWLTGALHIPASSLPNAACTADSQLLERISPYQAVLVFPSAAMKGLGAMFGHTLIRFDAKDKSALISYTVSYAALSDSDNFFGYIYKGLTGGFKGYYTLAPYYQKLHEYRDMEERDIWEYTLDCTPDEVRMMALHSMELQNIATKYYFLDENCALNLLFIIEAGRPSLRLVEHYWNQSAFWVIPSDTILFLCQEGIMRTPQFEASLSRQLDFYSGQFAPEIVKAARNLADSQAPGTNSFVEDLSPDQFKDACGLAAKIVQYKFTKLEMPQNEFETKYAYFIHHSSKSLPEFRSTAVPPHDGHPSGRIECGFGYLSADSFMEIGLRPAYHDWNDLAQGYPEGSTLNFLDAKIRYYPEHNHFKIEQIDLLKVGSLSPGNLISQQNAWVFDTGVSQMFLSDFNQHFLFNTSGGIGKSYHFFGSGMVYFLAGGSVLAGPGLTESFDTGPKIDFGYSHLFGSNWQINLACNSAYYGISEHCFLEKASLSLINNISTKNSLAFNIDFYEIGWKHGIPEIFIRWQHYF